MEKDDPGTLLSYLAQVQRQATARANRALAPLGLTFAQHHLLGVFAARPRQGHTVSGLARLLDLPQPGITKLLAKLAAKMFLEIRVDPADRRSGHHFLTLRGFNAAQAGREALTDLLADWSTEERAALAVLAARRTLPQSPES